MRLCGILALISCGGPAPAHPTAAAAAGPMSLAANTRMVVVPAGQFVAGSTPEERAAAYDDYRATAGVDVAREHHWFDSEDDRHVVALAPAFRIDLMPVTQAEYAEYVAAGQAPAPAIDEAGWVAQHLAQDYKTQVERFVWHDDRPPLGREDHPVVLVTWNDAAGYCRWRGLRLPSADEYEKAARGTGGVAYPWGNSYEPDKLNSAVRGPRDTMPVGSFPAGASPYGVLDAAGNVFEWTATPVKDGEMIVKGSSWEDFAGVGRGASRHGRRMSMRHVIVGFRCAGDA